MPPTILVVDDHPETRTLIARTLQPQGYEVTTVPDGEAALTLAATQRPDLVIADVMWPGLDGLRVVDTLRRRDPQLPVIVTGTLPYVLAQPEAVPAGLDPGSIPFLAKPFPLGSLIDLVQQVLPDAVLG